MTGTVLDKEQQQRKGGDRMMASSANDTLLRNRCFSLSRCRLVYQYAQSNVVDAALTRPRRSSDHNFDADTIDGIQL